MARYFLAFSEKQYHVSFQRILKKFNFSFLPLWFWLVQVRVIGNSVFPLLLVLHKIAVFSGYIAAWFGSGFLVTWSMRKRWFVWLSQFSFVIFGLHAPLVAYAINAVLPLVNEINNYRFLVYALLPMGLFIFCIAIGALIRGVLPRLFAILTGGRGI